MVHGSFGTLGVLSRLVFKLVPAKPFVRVQYEKYRTLAEYRAAIWGHYKAQDIDFMDGIIHAPDEYVLSVARFRRPGAVHARVRLDADRARAR